VDILGIDIGGSGIKGAPVDTIGGKLLGERYRLATPRPAGPPDVARCVKKIARHFQWQGPIGCGFPAVVQQGVVRTASNIDKGWIGLDVQALFGESCGMPVNVINDADAAGLAEVNFGHGQQRSGSMVLITIGTGLGSAVFFNRRLIPNTELGHLIMNGDIAENYASDSARKREDLTWKRWGKRFNDYLGEVERILWPELIVLGGGASKKFDKYERQLSTRAEVLPAKLLNEAGIIGAACAARGSD